MKANKLQIGDWVLFAIRPTKINGISEGGVSVLLENAGWQSIREIKPIPLTAKILEKTGFVYTKPETTTVSEDNVWQVKDNDNLVLIEIEEQIDDDLLDFYIGSFFNGTNYCEIYFRYVHELQHAFNLCGIEREIKF